MNEESKRIALLRPRIIRAVQHYLDGQGLVEVETPVLQPILGGAAARPFVTHHNTLDMDFYLRIATELPLKRLIVGGLEGVYEIGRLFRNEGMDPRHNPEFTTLEAYVAYSDMEGMMKLNEGLFESVAMEVFGKTDFVLGDKEISLKAPFKRWHMVDAVKEVTGVDFNEINSDEDHIHILFTAYPNMNLAKFVNAYKSASARYVRKENAEFLEKYYWKPYFWSSSYFICTVSDRSEAVIRQYIKNQGNKK